MTRDKTWMEKHWAKVLVLALAALIIIPVIFNYWMAPMIFSENRDAGEDIAKDTMDSEKAVQDYRDFRRLWFDIKSAREQLDNYQQQEEEFHETYGDDPKEWSRTAETRHGRIHDRITGQRNQISNLVSEYNAKRSDATQAIFTCGLPYRIDEKLYIADASGVEYTSQEAKSTTPPENPEDCKFSEAPGEASNTS
jgi:hypothetical protein